MIFPLIELSREALEENAMSLLGNEYCREKEQELLQWFDVNERKLEHWKLSPKTIEELLQEVDKILNNCGIETLYDQDNDILKDTVIYYSNTGDSYSYTIIYYNGGFYIGDWASLLEYLEDEE